MGKTVQITCDGCGKDLTYTGNCEDYYLVVTYASKKAWYEREGMRGGFVTSMAIRPPIDRDHYFCDLECLDHWRGRENRVSALWREWYAVWKAEHGTKRGNYYSYPEPPEDIRKARATEFEAAALAAFPMAKPPAPASHTGTPSPE